MIRCLGSTSSQLRSFGAADGWIAVSPFARDLRLLEATTVTARRSQLCRQHTSLHLQSGQLGPDTPVKAPLVANEIGLIRKAMAEQ